MPPGQCDISRGLNGDGSLTRGDDPSCVVVWSDCPGKHLALRRHGQEVMPLSDIVAQIHDRGDHRLPHAPAPIVRLVTEWARCKDLPQQLLSNKRWRSTHKGQP